MDESDPTDGAASMDVSEGGGMDGFATLLPRRPPPPALTALARNASVATSVRSLMMKEGEGDDEDDEKNEEVCIRLSREEEDLFATLLAAADAHESGCVPFNPNPNLQTIKREAVGSGKKGSLAPPPPPGRVEIRVAGGWVRDKILNQHSHDVDVALDCMSGVQFAQIVQSYLIQCDQGTGHGGSGSERNSASSKRKSEKPKFHVISANPSQSKHLETATMKVHGVEVDFVNLRAEEVYETGSRIPNTASRFGTPSEDAYRRDFTINSLFYNIRTRQVEDWTGRGLDDLLRRRLVVTPLDPHTTFHDDPLRVLRAIRFCVRYDLELDPTLREAAMSREVHRSLHVKVSRERVGKELEGMLTGKGARPGRALDLITDLKLAGSVFCYPVEGDLQSAIAGTILGHAYEGDHDALAHLREIGWEEARELLRLLPVAMEAHSDEVEKMEATVATEEDNYNNERAQDEDRSFGCAEGQDRLRPRQQQRRPPRRTRSSSWVADVQTPSTIDARLLHLAVFLLPFQNLTFVDRKGKTQTVVQHMIKDGVKFKTKDITNIGIVMEHCQTMRSILGKLRGAMERSQDHEFPSELPNLCRLETGMALRAMKELWVTGLLLATVADMRSMERQGEGERPRDREGLAAVLVGDTEADNAAQHIGTDGPSAGVLTRVDDVVQTSREMYRAIMHLGLDWCWKMRPLLDGRAIISALDLPRGPLVGMYLDDQVRWMLLNPSGTREECEMHLRQRKRERETDDGGDYDQNVMGVSDGGASSPVFRGDSGKHFSKRMHLESMDLLE